MEKARGIPVGTASPAQIRNLVFTLYSRQDLINRMTQSDMLCLPDTLIDRLRESLPESAEGFTSLLDDPETSAGLKGFDIREGKVRVAFPYDETRPERWTAYATLLKRIYDAAMKATRVSPARIEPDDGNEKYQAHAWLQRLGYGGADSKADRKVLIGHLKGYAAFKDESRMRAHLDRLAARRAAAKETHENDNA